MAAGEISEITTSGVSGRTKRRRSETLRAFPGSETKEKYLELEGIVNVLRNYNDYEGGVNCSVCGKLYKSKVCLTKHLWEHSVYWDQFDGVKNHDRVLSIQAALIIYSGFYGHPEQLTSLLVTSPHQPTEKKPWENSAKNLASPTTSINNSSQISDSSNDSNIDVVGLPEVFKTPEKKKVTNVYRTPSKGRKRRIKSSVRKAQSLPIQPPFSLLDTGISPSKSARQM